MCGITGLIDPSLPSSEIRCAIQRMTDTMVHRGPDDEGFYAADGVGLGMRRLSIIDLESGNQPIHNEERSVWITHNGEIYNFPELRQQLEAKGHRFYTRSDTEVIVHAYEEWGDDCVSHLNGIFGFAIWDQGQQRLFLARDHFGVKPLYYWDDGERLLWGSEIKAILTGPSVLRVVDLEALDLFLTFRFVPSPFTMFQGIRKLAPGHRLIYGDGNCKVERYWRPQPHLDGGLSERDHVLLLQERLEAAVRRQMISDVPIGALLSGGIDSATVVAIMSQLTDHPVRTFTVGFKDNTSVNELKEARASAALFHTEHHEIVLDSLDYRQFLERAVWHLEEPISTTSVLPMYFVCELARRHVTVVLTGQGADEPLAGYHRYYGERYGHLYRRLPHGVHRYLVPLVEMLPRQERAKRAVRSLGTCDVSERFAQAYAVFTDEMKSTLWNPEHRPETGHHQATHIVDYWRQGIGHLDSLIQMAYVDARLSLSDDLLMYGDKMSMAHSIEARVPFLDLEYMAAAESLPASLRIRGWTRKYIHKKAVAKWLPQGMIHRSKRGFETPMDRWFRSELSGYVRDTLLAPGAACRTYFEPGALETLISDHVSGRQDNRRQLFSLLVFELWHHRFIAEVGASP
jgi:asparagine synthase (glutamine-hydrolysing)